MIEIGSSEAPVVLGVSPHETPWHCWARKVKLIEVADQPDEIMTSGTSLQDVVLDMELREEGTAAHHVDRQTSSRHDERKWQRATPDGNLDGAVLYEVKCLVGQPPSSPRVADVVQCLHQLLVFEGAEHVRLIYFGGLRRERFIIPRHQAALDRVLREEEAFLELVEKEIPPPISARDASVLWRAWPLARDECVTLPADALAWDLVAVEAGRELADAQERYNLARGQIKAAMGPYNQAVIPGTDVRYTWRMDRRGQRALKRKGGE